jgi:hypothetical protein
LDAGFFFTLRAVATNRGRLFGGAILARQTPIKVAYQWLQINFCNN